MTTISHGRRFLAKFAIGLVTALAIGIVSLSGGGAVAAHAAASPTHSSSSAPRSVGGTAYCLVVHMYSATAIGTNTVAPTGDVVNACGFTVTGITFHLYGYVSGCGGISGDGSDYTNLPNMSPGATQPWSGQITGVCEVCENGVPTQFPPVTLVSQADAIGTGPNNVNVDDTGTAEVSTTLQNSPAYAFPCP